LSRPRTFALTESNPRNGETFGPGEASIRVARVFLYNSFLMSYLAALAGYRPDPQHGNGVITSSEDRAMGVTIGSAAELGERKMKRSDRVFDALHTLRNRYMLCQLASKATRKFHKPNTRIQETMNEVLERIASSERQSVLAEPETFSEAQRRAA
jgi:hypothetical protein